MFMLRIFFFLYTYIFYRKRKSTHGRDKASLELFTNRQCRDEQSNPSIRPNETYTDILIRSSKMHADGGWMDRGRENVVLDDFKVRTRPAHTSFTHFALNPWSVSQHGSSSPHSLDLASRCHDQRVANSVATTITRRTGADKNADKLLYLPDTSSKVLEK